jgi:hypothetical protein
MSSPYFELNEVSFRGLQLANEDKQFDFDD